MSRAKFIVALWFTLNGVWPLVPMNLHEQEGTSTAESVDIAAHMFGLLAVCVLLYDRYVERRP